MNDEQNEVISLVEKISPLLGGRAAEVQSAVIAELLSIWVLGFYIPGNPKATKRVQAKFLARHLQLVRDLIASAGDEIYQERLKRN